jgi:hypothetical protein
MLMFRCTTTTRAKVYGVSSSLGFSISCKLISTPMCCIHDAESSLTIRTTFFVIGFSTFLFSCIDYSLLSHELSGPDGIGRLDDVLVGSCLTG